MPILVGTSQPNVAVLMSPMKINRYNSNKRQHKLPAYVQILKQKNSVLIYKLPLQIYKVTEN